MNWLGIFQKLLSIFLAVIPVKGVFKALFGFIEDQVANTENKIDDNFVKVIKILLLGFDLMDDDKPAEPQA